MPDARRPIITAGSVRHAARKATTQRDERVVSLHCTGRRRGRGPVQIVLLRRLALLARVAFGAYLTQPRLSQHLVDLPGEFARQVGARVLVRHRGHVDQQPGVSSAQLHLRGIEQAEQEVPENLINGKRAQPPHVFAGVLRRRLVSLPGVTWPSSAHDSEPPTSSSGWAAMLPAPITPGCADYRNCAPADAGCRIARGRWAVTIGPGRSRWIAVDLLEEVVAVRFGREPVVAVEAQAAVAPAQCPAPRLSTTSEN